MNAICAVTTCTFKGVTAILIAGRITEPDGSPMLTEALDHESARFLARSLALATGSAVHVTYRDDDGEHNFNARPDRVLMDGPGRQAGNF
jgi:hypothetical protein